MFKRKKPVEPPKPMTVGEAFAEANEGFDFELVNKYADDAPTRELWQKTEKIKQDIQRVIDVNGNVFKWNNVIIFFEENAQLIPEFFIERGFTVDWSTEKVGEKLHLNMKIDFYA